MINLELSFIIFRVDSVIDPWVFNLIVAGPHVAKLPNGGNVRKAVADTIHKVQQKVLSTNEGDTKSINLIIYVRTYITTHYSVNNFVCTFRSMICCFSTSTVAETWRRTGNISRCKRSFWRTASIKESFICATRYWTGWCCIKNYAMNAVVARLLKHTSRSCWICSSLASATIVRWVR